MTEQLDAEPRTQPGAGIPASQEVSWWATHEFITAVIATSSPGTSLPWAGTPAWSALDDADPRKLLALAVAGEHHVLRIEIGQDAIADAGEQISAAEDWSQMSRDVQHRHQIDNLRRTA